MANNERLYFDTLKRISKEYMTTEQLQRRAGKMYGLSYHEALEMSYDNIQGAAADAIRGKRRPKSARCCEGGNFGQPHDCRKGQPGAAAAVKGREGA